MKLVIKYDEQIKLFSKELQYDVLLAFVQAQFKLTSHCIEITFTDQDGDNITIASDDDIDILKSYFTDKEYVKISVKAQPIVNAQSLPLQPQEQKIQEIKVKKIKDKSKKSKEKLEAANSKEKASKEKPQKKSTKIQEIKKLMSLAVAQLVDERIKALIPCIQQQVHNPVQRVPIEHKIVHLGYQCSLCLTKPIIGIRYDCNTCHSFTICSQCEDRTEHQHNLLQVKHLQAPKKEEPLYLDQICKLIIEREEQFQKKKEKSSAKDKKEQKQEQELKEKLKNAKKSLIQLFGSEPDHYKPFVKKHKDASIESIVNKYIEENQISSQEYKEKLILLQNNRLCKKFKREGNFYKQFVGKHLHFDLNVILKAMQNLGIEKKPKQQKKNKVSQSSKKIKKSQIKQEVKEEIKPEIIQEPIPRKLSSKIEGSSQLKGEKLQILNLMIEFFGPTHTPQYIKFIEANQSYGREQILQNWANKFSVLHP